jgi:hypothetical protein
VRATPLALLTVLATVVSSPLKAEEIHARLRPTIPAAANPGLAVQDPLMRQILRQQLTEPNGGIKGFAAPKVGPAIELKLGDLAKPGAEAKDAAAQASADPLAPLKPAAGLAAEPAAPQAPKKAPRKASAQLKALEKGGWGGQKKDDVPAPKKSKPAEAELL